MMARLNAGPQPSESPMDFAYDDGRGPVSADSPFLQNDLNNLPYKDSFAGHKRPSSELDSPTKPSLPALRKPEGQTYLFPSTPSSKVLPGFRAPSFTTPQRPIETDFSSGGELSSPANADSEDTPDPPIRMGKSTGSRSLVQFEGSKSGKKSSSSPLSKLHRKYTDVVARRVYNKRRRREGDDDVRDASARGGGGEENDAAPRNENQPKQMGFIPSVLTFIDAHPGLPNTLSVYVQFLLNLFFAFCIMYLLWGILATIRSDIDEKAMVESSEILAEMASCAHEYKENRCERESRVPAMETVCNSWEKCMQRDPYKVGRSRLSAGMFAEIFNSFIEPLSMKAIAVTIASILSGFALINLSFGAYRAKHAHLSTPPHPSPSSSAAAAAAPPPSMYMQPQIPYPAEGYYTPYHHHQQQQMAMQSPERVQRAYALEAAPTPAGGDGRGSPRKGGGGGGGGYRH